MVLDDETIRRGLLGFMAARCDVTSRHKLPTEAEILETAVASFLGLDRTKVVLDDLVRSGMLRRYGPYLSDREINDL